MEHCILLVNERAAERRRFAEALISVPPPRGASYKITAAPSAAAAKLRATRQSYHLLIAWISNDNEALELAHALHDLDQDLAIVLFAERQPTAHEANIALSLGARIVNSTVDDQQFYQLVGEALGLLQPSSAAQPAAKAHASDEQRPATTLADVQLLLDMLRRQCSAQLILYTDKIGHIIAERGDRGTIDLTSLTSLIAGGFVNSIELGSVLRDPETIHLNVHEGTFFDAYSTNVGVERMIVLLFDRQIVTPRLGLVWLLMKRAANQLRTMNIVEKPVGADLGAQISASLNDEFDRLFGSELLYSAEN